LLYLQCEFIARNGGHAYVSYALLAKYGSYVDDCPVPPAPFEELLKTYVTKSDRTEKYTPKIGAAQVPFLWGSKLYTVIDNKVIFASKPS